MRDLARDPSRDLSPLRLSVIVPVHNGERDLDACLSALLASDIPRDEWQLIVVDDASTDSSGEIAARYADKLIRIQSPPRGPAYARNRGIEEASYPAVAFVDADVMVHADALRLMRDALNRTDTDAVFGAYDDRPTDRGIVSQYRNLLHSFVHQRAAGFVESFWAGCGAALKDAVISAGTFDEIGFRRPEMEDVELGYRMRDAGYRILLDSRIRCTHRKAISFLTMISSDFSRRGIPWTRLLVRRRMLGKPRGLSLGASERVSAAMAVTSLLTMIAALGTMSPGVAILSAVSLAVFVAANWALFASYARLRGLAFTVAVIALHLAYNVVAAAALVWGVVTYPFSRSGRERYTRRR